MPVRHRFDLPPRIVTSTFGDLYYIGPSGLLTPLTAIPAVGSGGGEVPVRQTDGTWVAGVPVAAPVAGDPGWRTAALYANPGATTTTPVGLVAPTVSGTPTAANDATGPYVKASSAATSFANAGWVTAFNECRRDWSPDWTAVIKTGTSFSFVRSLWVGYFSATPAASPTAAGHVAAFLQDGALSAFWRCVTRNGTTTTTTVTTRAITPDTRYTLRIVQGAANVKFYVNGTLVATHTTNLPTATQATGWAVIGTTNNPGVLTVSLNRVVFTHI